MFWHLLTRRRKRLGGSRIRRLEEQISRRERELVAYRDNAALPTRLGAQRFADGLSVRLRRVEAARRELADAQTATTAPSLPAPAALRKRWPSMSVRDRRAAIAEVVEAVFVARRGPLEKRLHVCVRGQAPSVPLYDPMHDKAEAAPFDSSAHQAARHGSNRAAGPIGELQQALEKFLADQTSWPPFSYFQRHGQAELHSEAERHGGTRHWASTLGVTYKPPNAQAAWPEERVRAELTTYLADATDWPAHKRFWAEGRGQLRRAVAWTGGPERWAREMGVSFSPRNRPQQRWSYERMKEGARKVAGDSGLWPTRDQFIAAGLRELDAAARSQGVKDRLLKDLGLKIRPRSVRKVGRWTDERVRAELDRFVVGRDTWPSQREFNDAGLRGLHSSLRSRGALGEWVQRYGFEPLQRGRQARLRLDARAAAEV